MALSYRIPRLINFSPWGEKRISASVLWDEDTESWCIGGVSICGEIRGEGGRFRRVPCSSFGGPLVVLHVATSFGSNIDLIRTRWNSDKV